MTPKRHPTPEIDLTREDDLPEAFSKALAKAKPGTRLLYHRGPSIGGTRLAHLAMGAYRTGKVELVQRKIMDGRSSLFEYIAIKRHKRT